MRAIAFLAAALLLRARRLGDRQRRYLKWLVERAEIEARES